jgi:hypothetical protein
LWHTQTNTPLTLSQVHSIRAFQLVSPFLVRGTLFEKGEPSRKRAKDSATSAGVLLLLAEMLTG